jgi:hypothetical protein
MLKIRPVGAELFHADGQTDMKLIVYFAILRKDPKNILELPVSCLHWYSKYN